jgi:hypothetical protein
VEKTAGVAVSEDTDRAGAAPTPNWPRRHPRFVVAAIVLVVAATAFVGITGATGLEGPGWLHRYPYRDLGRLADTINAEAGELRTPDDCWRTTPSTDDATRDPAGPLREIAKVDYVRSRVVVRVYASESGRVDGLTRHSVTNRLDRLFDSDDELSWDMVELEPSPDGWSPLVSCRLVTRGWILGF